jgi:hypothetical protein
MHFRFRCYRTPKHCDARPTDRLVEPFADDVRVHRAET